MSHNKNYPSADPTRKSWVSMMSRCTNPKDKDYANIGGKGIKVCPEWYDYEVFKQDMGEKPEGTIMQRYVNTLDFTPSNTYWMVKVNATTNRVYGIWKGIKRRCGLIGPGKSRAAEHYQARGIELYPDWVNDFQAFANYVGKPPDDEHTLDRIDNNMGYVPGNLRWANKKEQSNNRSDNIVIEMNGERRTLQGWCDYLGADRVLVASRWQNLFSPEKQTKNRPCKQLSLCGSEVIAEYEGVKAAAAATGIKQGTIAKCLSGGNASAGGFRWEYVG